jgi:preprotein translocase subunit SecA
MSLYKNWSDMVVNYVKEKGEDAFWKEYGAIETKIYTKLLSEHEETIEGNIKELSAKFDVDPIFLMGFLDGVNDSLKAPIDLEKTEIETPLQGIVDYEKLYFNMLDAKADYLYELPQWESIFSKEKRKDIQRSYKDSKTVVNAHKIGRNDPCPCGSGKKYKKCCGSTSNAE